MNPLVLILARAQSKGVPGKNTRLVAGRPCIEWTFDHAQTVGGTVACSTDDPTAARLARARGFPVVDRPTELASDSAPIDDAARHAVRELAPPPDQPVAILYANVPVRPPNLTARALDLLRSTGCHSVQSYHPVGKCHPWWMVQIDDLGRVQPWHGNTINNGVYRRQDLPPAFLPDGGVIALTQDALFLRVPGVPPGPHAFLGSDRRAIITPQGAVIDIDHEHDLALAHAALAAQHAA